MAELLLEMEKDLTQALIKAGNVHLEDMNATLQKTYATLIEKHLVTVETQNREHVRTNGDALSCSPSAGPALPVG
jgi:hypothetical protein